MQYFTDNNIGPDGAQSIAEALKSNNTITKLDLYGMDQIITLFLHHCQSH